jgi:predicted transcriptional regulator
LNATLSPSLRRLLEEHIDSFEKLHVVVEMQRSRDHSHSIAKLAAATSMDRHEIRTAVDDLVRARLLEPNGAGYCLPSDPTTASVLEELATMYETDKSVLVIAIAEISMHRLRSLAGRAFAEAFVIRKKPGGKDG